MKKTYCYWFSLLLLLATTSGWAQTFTPILERGVFRPVSEVSGEAKLTVSGNYLYFVGRDGSTGPELWRTDGTPGGTKLVKDITPGPEYGYNTPTSLFDMNGTLYFFAGPALYKTDGTEAGTMLLRNFDGIGGGNLLSYNGLLIFIIDNGLWRTDGTPEGTYRLARRPSINPRVYNGSMYFLSSSGPTFQETDFLRSDGTLAGTSLVTQLPGTVQSFGIGSDGIYLTSLTGNFHATPGQWRTWRSDGTAAGTVPLGPVTSTRQPGYFNAFGDLYQRQNDVGLVPTLRQNKTTGAFEPVTPTPDLEVLQRGVPYNGQLYGNAYTPATGQELSRLDGSPVRDLNPGSATGILLLPVVANGLLYFTGNDGTTGFELWQSDGSASGTRLTGDLFPGRSSYPLDLTVYKGDLYFDTWEGTLYKLNPQQTPPSDPTPPTTGGTLTLTQPTYDCSTGAITFNSTGGDGSIITYSAPGIMRSSVTSSTGTVEQGLRNDPKTILITAMQSGQMTTYGFDLKATCAGTTPTPTPGPIPPTTGGTLTLTQPTYDCSTGAITFNSTGGDGTTITYSAPGIMRSSVTSSTGTVEQGLRNDPKTILITAMQSGQMTTYSFDFRSFCSGNPPTPAPTPPATGNTLTLTEPTYNCSTGSIMFNYTGGNSSPVEFQAAGITGWTTNPNQFVDKDSRTANDVKPFTLMGRQNGQVVTYTWDLKAACGRSARVAAAEAGQGLRLTVKGNPVGNTAIVAISGVEGQAVQFDLLNANGHMLEQRYIEQAGAVDEQRFDVQQQPTGMLFLRAQSGQQKQTIKLIKQ